MGQQLAIPHGAPIRGNHNLPVRPPDRLFGRDSDLASVHLALKAGAAVLLHGPAGIGKTALAATLAAGYAELPGGVLWFEVTASDSIRSLLNRVSRAYAAPVFLADEDPTDQASLLKELIQESNPLIVLDGFINADVAREFVRTCASGAPLLLIQQRLVAGPWTPYAIPPLPDDTAESMLIHLAGVSNEADITETARLSRVLGGHALSLFVTARQLATQSATPGGFLSQMPETHSSEPTRAIGAVLMAAYRLMPSPLQGMALLIGTAFASGGSEELLGDVAGAPIHVVRSSMRQLAARGFVSERTVYDQSYFVAHEMVQAFAQAFLRGNQQLETMQARHVQGLLAYIRRHTAEDSPAHHNRLAAEIETLLAATAYTPPDALEEIVQLITPRTPESFVRVRGFQPELDLLREQIAPPAQVQTEPPVPTPAEVIEAPSAVPPPPRKEPESEADMLRQRGQQAAEQNNLPQAVEYDIQALKTYQEGGDTQGQLEVLDTLADLSLEQGKYEDALGYIEQGLGLARQLENPHYEGHLLVMQADLQALLGKDEGAEAAYQEAANVLRPTDDWLNMGLALDKLGSFYLDRDRQQDALAVLEQAVPIFERAERPDCLSSTLIKLGDAHSNLTQWEQAQTCYDRALENAQTSGDNVTAFGLLSKLGVLSEISGNRVVALTYYRQALYLAFEMEPDSDRLGQTLLALGRLLIDDIEQLNRVIQLLEAANEHMPDNTEAQRLLKRAKTRLERLVDAGVTMLLIEDDLHNYAQPPGGRQ